MKNQYTPLQTKWLDALESGEFKQCPDVLRDGDSFCCLGIATHLVDPNHDALIGDYEDVSIGHTDNYQTAPDNVVEDMMFRGSEGGSEVSLAKKNDDGTSFEEIATFVRKNPHLVFTNFEDK